MASIPDSHRDLFEGDVVAQFATVMPDGTPHVTPVWIDYDPGADRILVNTARGRRKERNVRANPKVGMSVLDPEDAYRYVSVRGEVTEVTTDGAIEHIDRLTRRYFGQEEYPHHGEEQGPRVIIYVRLDRVVTA